MGEHYPGDAITVDPAMTYEIIAGQHAAALRVEGGGHGSHAGWFGTENRMLVRIANNFLPDA
jgi:hypothetical protein